ncbi:MAG TPA: hypothetical protein VM103_00645, partial [Candidatus Paceibacterota bacterium]|nr:hypothetical protein [Candidatus Paceibacterota bacterium]
IEKTRTKAFAWVAAARAKEPNLAYVRLAKEEITENALEEAAQAGSLFAKRTLTLLDDPFQSTKSTDEDEEGAADAGAGSVLEEKLDMLIESENVIVILAPKLSAAKAKKVSAKAKMAYVFDAPATREFSRGFNGNLVNALGARDGAQLWIEIMRALRAGDAPEMLHGLLHWKARDLLEKGGRSWKPGEARKLSLNIIKLLQENRRKGGDFSQALERFALSI